MLGNNILLFFSAGKDRDAVLVDIDGNAILFLPVFFIGPFRLDSIHDIHVTARLSNKVATGIRRTTDHIDIGSGAHINLFGRKLGRNCIFNTGSVLMPLIAGNAYEIIGNTEVDTGTARVPQGFRRLVFSQHVQVAASVVSSV